MMPVEMMPSESGSSSQTGFAPGGLRAFNSDADRQAALHSAFAERVDDVRLADFIDDELLRVFIVRGELMRFFRAGCYALLVTRLIEDGRIATAGAPHVASLIFDLTTAGYNALALRLARAVTPGQHSAAYHLGVGRLLAMAGDGERALAAAELAGATENPPPLEAAYLRGWVLHHLLGRADEAAIVAAKVDRERLAQVWPEAAALPAPDLVRSSSQDPIAVAGFVAALAGLRDGGPIEIVDWRRPNGRDPAPEWAAPFLTQSAVAAPLAEVLAAGKPASAAFDLAPQHPFESYAAHVINSRAFVQESAPLGWRAQAILDGRGVAMASPHHGGMLTSRHSFGSMLGGYAFATAYVEADPTQSFMLINCGSALEQKDLLLMPAQRRGFLIAPHGPAAAEARMAVQGFAETAHLEGERLRRFLTGDVKPVLVTGFQPNLSHHYQNEVSALWRLHRRGDLARFAHVLHWGRDYFDAVRMLGIGADKLVRVQGPAAVVTRRCLDEGWSPCRLNDSAAYRELGADVMAHALAHSSPIPDIEAIGDRSALHVTLRSNRRVWRSQVPGVIACIRALHEAHGLQDVLLDGVTMTNAEDAAEARWIADERAIAAEIVAGVGGAVRCHVLVGLPMPDKLRACRKAGFCLAPKGNGWVPNMAMVLDRPALLHGNAIDLPSALWDARMRSDGPMPVLLDRIHIDDGIGATLDRQEKVSETARFEGGYELKEDAVVSLTAALAGDALISVPPAAPPEKATEAKAEPEATLPDVAAAEPTSTSPVPPVAEPPRDPRTIPQWQEALRVMNDVPARLFDAYGKFARAFMAALEHQPDDGLMRWMTPLLLDEPELLRDNNVPHLLREVGETDTFGNRALLPRVAQIIRAHDPATLTPRQRWVRAWILLRLAALPEAEGWDAALRLLTERNFTRVAFGLPSDVPELRALVVAIARRFIDDPAFRLQSRDIAYNLLFLVQLHEASMFDDVCLALAGTLGENELGDVRTSFMQSVAIARRHVPFREARLGLSAPARLAGLPRLVVCVSGQLRGFREAFESWRHFGLPADRVTYVVHSWRNVGRSNPMIAPQAQRSLRGAFLPAHLKTLAKLGEAGLSQFYPSLVALLRAPRLIDEAELKAFYNAPSVVLEDDEVLPISHWSNVDKMFHKMQAADELGAPFADPTDMMIRIRPDIVLKPLNLDWTELRDASVARSTVFCARGGMVFRAGGFGVDDQFAFGAPALMRPYARSRQRVTGDGWNDSFVGFNRGCIGHTTMFWAALEQGVVCAPIEGIERIALADPEPFAATPLLSALQSDVASRPAQETDEALLQALISDSQIRQAATART